MKEHNTIDSKPELAKTIIVNRWFNKITPTQPYRDEIGNVIEDNPPMNVEGFWKKPKVSTADIVSNVTKKNYKRR